METITMITPTNKEIEMATNKKAPTTGAVKPTAKVDAAGRRKKTAGEPQFANYADREVTPVIQNFSDWIERETGYKPDPMSVYLGSALRSKFQKSDENQQRMIDAKNSAAEAVEAKAARRLERAARAEERLERAAAAKEARETRAAEKTAKAETKKAPATEATKAPVAKKAAPSKAATKPTPRRRPVKAAADTTEF